MSKFGNALAERLHEISLEGGQDEEIGSVDELDWCGLFVKERAILVEDSQGFVDAIDYETEDELLKAWEGIEAMYSEYYGEDDDSNGGQF
jgi:hypothetical protein